MISSASPVGSKLAVLLLNVEPNLTFPFDGKTCLLLWQSQMLCASFNVQIPVPLFLTPNVETNLRALPIPDSFKSPFQIFQTAWEQTDDILLLSLAQLIFIVCIWLLFCSPEGWGGNGSPEGGCWTENFSLKAAPSFGSCLLVGFALNLNLRA